MKLISIYEAITSLHNNDTEYCSYIWDGDFNFFSERIDTAGGHYKPKHKSILTSVLWTI